MAGSSTYSGYTGRAGASTCDIEYATVGQGPLLGYGDYTGRAWPSTCDIGDVPVSHGPGLLI